MHKAPQYDTYSFILVLMKEKKTRDGKKNGWKLQKVKKMYEVSLKGGNPQFSVFMSIKKNNYI